MGKTFKDSDASAVAKQLGQRGGLATFKKYGTKHFKKLGKSKKSNKEVNE